MDWPSQLSNANSIDNVFVAMNLKLRKKSVFKLKPLPCCEACAEKPGIFLQYGLKFLYKTL